MSPAGSGPVAQIFDPTIQADKLFGVEGLVALVIGGGTGKQSMGRGKFRYVCVQFFCQTNNESHARQVEALYYSSESGVLPAFDVR